MSLSQSMMSPQLRRRPGTNVENSLKEAQKKILALKNQVNEKELALLENDAAFSKQLFHLKKLLGEREKVVAAQRHEIVQLQQGVHRAQNHSSQAVQSQFNDFLGQINALKVVVVQLEQKLREKSQEQAQLQRSYQRAVQDRGSHFEEQRALEQQSSSQTQQLQRKIKSLLQANAALTEQHRREQQSYEIELQRLKGQLGLETSRGQKRDTEAIALERAQLKGQIASLVENEDRLQHTISIMADRIQEQEKRNASLHDKDRRIQELAQQLDAARAELATAGKSQHSNNRGGNKMSHNGPLQTYQSRPQPQSKVQARIGSGVRNPGNVNVDELQAALEASQTMCIRLDDEVKSLQKQLQQKQSEALAGQDNERANGSSQLNAAVDEDENVMQCAYAFLMRATSLMTQLQCHLDGDVNSAQLPPPTESAIYRGTPSQLCHALRSMEKAIPDLQDRVTDAYAQSLSGECAMQ